jgi:hypothetical protein
MIGISSSLVTALYKVIIWVNVLMKIYLETGKAIPRSFVNL